MRIMPAEMQIKSRYVGASLDPTYSTLDPALVKAQSAVRRPIYQPTLAIVRIADDVAAEAEPQRRSKKARCLAVHLNAQAQNNALEGARSAEDNYYREWMIGALAIAYLKAGDELDAMPEAPSIRNWLHRNGEAILVFNRRELATRAINNHRYWGALAVTAVGQVTGDDEFIDFGREILREGLESVDEDGMLDAELMRGKRAEHYHIFAAAPLAAIALLTGAPVDENRSALLRLTRAIAASSRDRERGPIARRAGAGQLPSTSMPALHLLKPFAASDPATRGELDKLTAGVASFYMFTGGDLSFLTERRR